MKSIIDLYGMPFVSACFPADRQVCCCGWMIMTNRCKRVVGRRYSVFFEAYTVLLWEISVNVWDKTGNWKLPKTPVKTSALVNFCLKQCYLYCFILSPFLSSVSYCAFSCFPKAFYLRVTWTSVLFFRGTVTNEGTHWDLKEWAVHMIFPPDAVPEPTLIEVHRWKSTACSPKLQEHEAVVSSVIEVSTRSFEGLEFKAAVKLNLSHSAAGLHGYELVIFKLTNKETNEWEDVGRTENLRGLSGEQPYFLLFYMTLS